MVREHCWKNSKIAIRRESIGGKKRLDKGRCSIVPHVVNTTEGILTAGQGVTRVFQRPVHP